MSSPNQNKELQLVIRALRFRSSISSLLRQATTELELSQKACQIAVSDVGYRMAWVGLAEQDPGKTVLPLCHSGIEDHYLSLVKISWADCELGRGPTGTAIRERRPVISRDFSTDLKILPWRQEGLRRGYHSSIALPLVVDDLAIGAFTLYGDQPDLFPIEEVNLLVEVANDLAYGITSLRLKEQRLQALNELKIAKEEAESANRLKSQFLDIAAHELRTPITAFSLLIQNITIQVKQGIPVELSTLNRISGQVDRISGIVDDLLNTSRLERGVVTIQTEWVDLISLASKTLNHFKSQTPMRHFSLIHPDQPVEVKVDPLRIEQVIGNLLDNAQKYSPERQPIDIKIDLLPNKIRISVTDHGIGISKEQQHSLFSRFFRISSNETIRHPGLGLGLFICRSIVELHKGTIGVESEINQGSTFYFDLPRETDV